MKSMKHITGCRCKLWFYTLLGISLISYISTKLIEHSRLSREREVIQGIIELSPKNQWIHVGTAVGHNAISGFVRSEDDLRAFYKALDIAGISKAVRAVRVEPKGTDNLRALDIKTAPNPSL